MANQRVGGIISVNVNGELQQAKGEFEYNLGQPLREPVVGSDGVHGFKETPQSCYLAGAITDRLSLNLKSFVNLEGATVTLALANGKTIAFRNGYYSGTGTGKTDEGEIDFKFDAQSAEEI